MKTIVILAGQSNMAGHGELSELDVTGLPAGVQLFDLNPRDGCFGPEIGFARTFLDSKEIDELWLIKYAVGGSSLLAWEPEWSAERAAITDDADKGALYPRLLNHFQRVTEGVDGQVLGCLWMQGESDSRYERAARQYQTNLTTLITRLRHDLNEADLPFVQGIVNPPIHIQTFGPLVREAQARVAQDLKNVSLVDTDDLTKHADDLHYDTAGQLELGRRFADQLIRQL